MAGLIKCKTCGAAVSKKAPSCPQCGKPMKRKTIGCGGGIAIVFLALAIGVAINQMNSPIPSRRSAATSSVAPTPQVDCTKQSERKALIDKMIAEGYWQKIERPATLYRIYVMPTFMNATTFDDKKSFLSMVSAYSICEGGESLVVIYDSITGNKLGDFSELGLDLE